MITALLLIAAFTLQDASAPGPATRSDDVPASASAPDDTPPSASSDDAGEPSASGERSTGESLLDLLGFSSAAHDGAGRGLRKLYEARAAVEAGHPDEAEQLMQDARVEWPGSAYVAQSLGDLHFEQGRGDEALFEYQRGAKDGFRFRSEYQSAVVASRTAEGLLSDASVPADEAAIPEGPLPPGMREAIEQALPQLEAARVHFCKALAERSDD
ncbi:MAG: hypothetical protein H6825_13175, partial [Planctomycetes bacterium]|nr:hypothetical protein [Planctomycetota bacterium]